MFDEENLMMVVIARGGSHLQLFQKNLGFLPFHTSHVALGAKLSGAGATLIFGGEVM